MAGVLGQARVHAARTLWCVVAQQRRALAARVAPGGAPPRWLTHITSALTARARLCTVAASLGLLLGVGGVVHSEAAPEAPAAQHVDEATGLSFPTRLGALQLTGTGVRYKFGLAKVYAVALYMPVSAVRAAGSALGALESVLRGEAEAAFVIKLYRAVGSKELGEALADAIAPHLREQAADERADAGPDLSALDAMGKALTTTKLGATLPPGTELRFRWTKAGLEVAVDSQPAGTFSSPRIGWGFYITFLCPNRPVIPAARAAFVKGLEQMRLQSPQL
jgi:hypothetical protein